MIARSIFLNHIPSQTPKNSNFISWCRRRSPSLDMPIVFNSPNTVQRLEKLFCLNSNPLTVSPYTSKPKLHASNSKLPRISILIPKWENSEKWETSRESPKPYHSVSHIYSVWWNYLGSDSFGQPSPLWLIPVTCDLPLGPALLYTFNFALWTPMGPASPTSWEFQGNLDITFLASHSGLSGSP